MAEPKNIPAGDMRSAHCGMNISEVEYMAVVDDLLKTMEEHGLDEQTRKDNLP